VPEVIHGWWPSWAWNPGLSISLPNGPHHVICAVQELEDLVAAALLSTGLGDRHWGLST
jgi:hypothetical protein